MENTEARALLQHIYNTYGYQISKNFKDNAIKDAFELADKALEKQIPKIVTDIHTSVNDEEMKIYGEDARFGSCPVCGELVCLIWDESYCGDCGQKLDWGCKNERE